MTESSPVTLMTPYVYPYNKVGSVGQLIPSTQGKIVSLTTGEMLGPHKSGELLLRGPQVIKRFFFKLLPSILYTYLPVAWRP